MDVGRIDTFTFLIPALTVFAGLIFIFITLRSPFRALLIMLPFMIITRPIGLPVIGDRIIIFDLLILVWWGCVFIRQVQGCQDVSFPKKLFWPILIYYFVLVSSFLSLINGISLLSGLEEIIVYAFLGIFALAIIGVVRTEKELLQLVKLVIVVLAIAIFYALWEVLSTTFGLPILFPISSEFRLAGTFRQTNQLASFLRTLLPIAWAMLFMANGLSPKMKAYLVLVSTLGIIILLLTSSRTNVIAALIELLIFVGVAIIQFFRGRANFSLQTIGLIISCALILIIFLPRVTGTYWQTFLWRFAPIYANIGDSRIVDNVFSATTTNPLGREFAENNWLVGFEAFKDHPWIGTGVGNFSLLYTIVRGRQYEVHSGYLNLLAERGIIGTLTFVIFLLLLLRMAIKNLYLNSTLFWIAFALLMAYLGSLISGVYVIFFRRREFWLVLSLIIVYYQLYSRSFYDRKDNTTSV